MCRSCPLRGISLEGVGRESAKVARAREREKKQEREVAPASERVVCLSSCLTPSGAKNKGMELPRSAAGAKQDMQRRRVPGRKGVESLQKKAARTGLRHERRPLRAAVRAQTWCRGRQHPLPCERGPCCAKKSRNGKHAAAPECFPTGCVHSFFFAAPPPPHVLRTLFCTRWARRRGSLGRPLGSGRRTNSSGTSALQEDQTLCRSCCCRRCSFGILLLLLLPPRRRGP